MDAATFPAQRAASRKHSRAVVAFETFFSAVATPGAPRQCDGLVRVVARLLAADSC